MLSTNTHAMTVTRTAETLGIPLPTGYVEQIAEVDAFTAAVAQIAVTTDQLHEAVLDAIADGRDYHADETVQRLALDRSLTAQNISAHRAQTRADQMRRAALADWADEILEDWADALGPHSAALVDAAADANLSDLTDTAAAVAKGGDTMDKLHHAQVAVKAWTAAVNGFFSLASISSVGYNGDASVAIYTPARHSDLAPAFALADKSRTDVDAWTLARCGIPLDLATLGDFMSRAATFNADRETEARAEKEQLKQRVANSW
ncbi:aldehyde dehydrogenase [Mycolicibacterium helvum]|nr:aldehyde dehydrogenase [Mycolicibacterium helvum]